MNELTELQKEIHQFSEERDWKQFHNPKDVAISLVLEAAELMEQFQWKTEQEIRAHLKSHKKKVADEMADTFYWLLLLAHDLEIDLSQAFHLKMVENRKKYPIEKAKGNHKKHTEY